MKENKQYTQLAGNLGHYGLSLDPEYNKRVVLANKIIDEYNRTVCNFETYEEQMEYQKTMKRYAEKQLFPTDESISRYEKMAKEFVEKMLSKYDE